jgi:tetratricopeptide (TPR) repeat protein
LAQLGGQICSAEPTPPRELCPEVSKALERVCLKALRRKPVDRYPDGEAFARAIESALAAREGVQVWLPLLGGVVALVFGIGIPVAALLSSPDPATAALPVGRTLPAEPLTPADPPLRGPDVEPVEPVKAVVPPDLESSLAEHTQWFEQAMQLSSEGNDAAAIDAYTRALEVRVTPRALVERGLCRMRGGDAAAAIVDYKRALDLYGPNDLARRVAAGHLRTAVRQQDRLNRGEEQ